MPHLALERGVLIPAVRRGPGCVEDGVALVRQPLPELFRDEGHDRMKQSQGHLEHLGRDARFRQPGLHQLEVIVGELMPGKFVERIDGRAEFETLESAGHDLHHPVEPAQDPAIGRAEARQVGPAGRFALQKDKAGSVPELVGEIPIVLDLLLREANVLAAGAEVRAPGARRIRPVGIHHVERIDPGSEGLAHPPSVRGQHGGVDQHVPVWLLATPREPDLVVAEDGFRANRVDDIVDEVARREPVKPVRVPALVETLGLVRVQLPVPNEP